MIKAYFDPDQQRVDMIEPFDLLKMVNTDTNMYTAVNIRELTKKQIGSAVVEMLKVLQEEKSSI